MRISGSLFIPFIVTAVSVFAPQLGIAQSGFSGPSGSFTNFLGGNTAQAWDLASPATRISYQAFRGTNGANVNFPAAVQQGGGGQLMGSNSTTTVNLRVIQDGQTNEFLSLPATYRIGGGFNSIPPFLFGSFRTTVTGFLTNSGVARKFISNHTVNFFVSPRFTPTSTNLIVSGTRIDSFSAPTLSSVSSRIPIQPQPTFFVLGDGSWVLTMTNISTVGKTISGFAAAHLNAGSTFQFKVRGLYRSQDAKSTLLLTAADPTARGSSLRVSMSTNVVTSIRGKVSGQAVQQTF